MTIKSLNKILFIDNDTNTRINGNLCSLNIYANDVNHQNEKVKSVYVQSNGVVVIKTIK